MDKVGCEVICKNHSARSERDLYRICPTKLSKSDLEDLYFTLLENNLQLKKTVNVQQDRIKVLSTKMQRMTSAQNVLRAEENKNCCVATKAVVSQQKDMIADLKRTNERMADRIRKLNMRLCSAKQFCKSATPRGLRCSTATSPYLIKHSPCSYKQQSHSTLKLAVSYHNLSRDTLVTKYVQTEPCDSAKLEETKSLCDDNKCKTLAEELKERIIELEEKLSITQQECDLRVSVLQGELQRSRGQRVASEHELTRVEERNGLLAASVRDAEGRACDLKTQLSIEKRRVAELETRLKAATISNRVSKSIEDTLTSIQESNKASGVEVSLTCSCSSPRSKVDATSQQAYPGLSPKGSNGSDATKLSRSADDSGYTDTSKSQQLADDQSLNKIIEELTKRIVVLQSQVDALTISPPSPPVPENPKIKADTPVRVDYNAPIVIAHSTPKTKEKIDSNSTQPQTTSNQNPQEQIQLTNIETSEAELNTPREEHPIPESSKSGNWDRNMTKLKLITSKVKEKDCTIKEKDNTIKERDSNKEKFGKSKVKSKETLEHVGTKQNEDIIENNVTKVKENSGKVKEISNRKGTVPEEQKEPIHNQELNIMSSTVEETSSDDNDPKIEIKKINTDNVSNEELVQEVKRNKKSGPQEKADSQNNVDSPKKLDKNNAFKYMNKEKQGKGTNSKSVLNAEQPKMGKLRTLLRTDTMRRNPSTCSEATYTVDRDGRGGSSPDDTDYEISSMSDLTDDREAKSPAQSRLSPGERKSRLGHCYSYSPSTNYSLSEGEIPVTSARRRSYDDKGRASEMATAPKMEETLQAVSEELARCRRLLHTHRMHDTSATHGV